MVFSSIAFLLYFLPAVGLCYCLVSFSRTLQNLVLLGASLLFYGWGEPRLVWLLGASVLVNSGLGAWMGRTGSRNRRKGLLILAVVLNLGTLFLFKYLMFVLQQLGLRPGFQIALPIGISFFTFQSLSYAADVYEERVKPGNPLTVGLYIAFFPQLIAGPILQYSQVADQIRCRRGSMEKLSLGICRFTAGLGKKVLLANSLGAIADNVFSWSAIGSDRFAVPVVLAWLGAVAYTLQIYYDFSGYSDMALGLGLMFGFQFPENFNYPYIARSVSDFWKRWHISLTSWFRQYVYFPLGGSRVEDQDRMVRNLFLVWLLTGIWHGANWTFLFWGMYYFLFQLAERFFGYAGKLPGPAAHLYTLLVVTVGWVIFRSPDLYQAGRFLLNLLGLNRNGFSSPLALELIRENGAVLIAGLLFAMPIARFANRALSARDRGLVYWAFTLGYPAAMTLVLGLSLASLASGSYNPFIYFNF